MARILVIDDEEPIRRIIKKILERMHHQVVEASNGKKGMEIQYSEPAELVITDLIMPEKEGIEIIIEIKEKFPQTKIIAISGGGSIFTNDYLKLAESLGAEYSLPKPFTPEQLIVAVNRVL